MTYLPGDSCDIRSNVTVTKCKYIYICVCLFQNYTLEGRGAPEILGGSFFHTDVWENCYLNNA